MTVPVSVVMFVTKFAGCVNRVQVNGVTIQEAVSKWWNSDFTDEAASHTYECQCA